VAGEPWGDLGLELERQLLRLDLGDRATLDLRWVSENELERLLAAADVVVLPYRSGSQSAMAPQALARGVPVLTTRVGGLAEVVEDGVNGLVVAPGSVDALTAALAALDDQLVAHLAAGARATAARLSWEGYADALLGLVARVTGNAR
jgi:glycosyltransferase involved in cell wall biosynthesis